MVVDTHPGGAVASIEPSECGGGAPVDVLPIILAVPEGPISNKDPHHTSMVRLSGVRRPEGARRVPDAVAIRGKLPSAAQTIIAVGMERARQRSSRAADAIAAWSSKSAGAVERRNRCRSGKPVSIEGRNRP